MKYHTNAGEEKKAGKNMQLLICGGCGFIGSNFIRYILNKYHDYKIINIDKLTYAGNIENLADISNKMNYTFIKGDICDSQLIKNVIDKYKFDWIINFAAETHVDRAVLAPESFIKTDILGTYTLLEIVKKCHIKYMHLSTDEVYGSIETGSFAETDPLAPNNPYSASKASADLLIRSYISTYNIPAIIIRPVNNFGPYQYPEKIIPLFITNAIDNKPLPLYGKGNNVRDWIYVLDTCKAIDLLLHKGVYGEIYNISANNEMTNITLTKAILAILGKDESCIKFVSDRPGHDKRYSLCCNKIKSLGWKVDYQFYNALQETVTWYKQNEHWWRKIKQRKEYIDFYNKQYGNL